MKTGQCPSCDGGRIGRLESLPEETHAGASYQALGTMRYPPTRTFRRRTAPARAPGKKITKAGTVEALVCSSCGRLETYVQDPQWVPFERLNGFSWISNPPADGGDQ